MGHRACGSWRAGWRVAMAAVLLRAAVTAGAADLERSYWVHASLGQAVQRGYWGPGFPAADAPTREEVGRAARSLVETCGANRLYLIYHGEIPGDAARRVFQWWREACPASVELVPALVLRMYDRARTPVFAGDELRSLAGFLRGRINPARMAVYDVQGKREDDGSAAALAALFPGGLVRIGLQPDEDLAKPFVAAVQDTWSGFCHGTRNKEDWMQPGFGAETLRRWVEARNRGAGTFAWNLVVVAWDYGATERGGYPGYDDAAKNRPLPAGRNRAGADLIARTAAPGRLAGFSSDLFILHENSRNAAHDGPAGAFYRTLREGREYRGYYAVPFREITGLYRDLAAGRAPAVRRESAR